MYARIYHSKLNVDDSLEVISSFSDQSLFSASDKFSENLQIVANEPSLAFFRIQEHVRKTLPQLSERKVHIYSWAGMFNSFWNDGLNFTLQLNIAYYPTYTYIILYLPAWSSWTSKTSSRKLLWHRICDKVSWNLRQLIRGSHVMSPKDSISPLTDMITACCHHNISMNTVTFLTFL